MPWLQLKLEADKNRVEQIIQVLDECGALSVTVEDKGQHAQFQEQSDTAVFWTHNRITGLFPANADVAGSMQQLEQHTGAAPAYSADTLSDRDWELAWQAEYRPVQISTKLWICPSSSTPPQPAVTNVYINPGLAFGSGTHPTTCLCLEWLAERDIVNHDVIDYGCAIAALKLGAQCAWGIDNDARALLVSPENAVHNGVSGRYRSLTPESLPPRLQADIVLANILAQPLIELAPKLTTLIRSGGNLVLSGLLESQASAVCACYARELVIEAQVQREDAGYRWVMLAMSKRHPANK
ncbi:MAG: 50S ribosomal protein L11 methyltransferase [Proteobacteria bacterium]|nr:MAG: 50S ribosomal protein L11 methyltransferase [Pseudomonadota bacterium]